MRTGKEYREALRDGRRVWVIGDGMIEDVTVHPATRAMVDEYATWYDRHLDPAWQDIVLAPPDASGARLLTRRETPRGMLQAHRLPNFSQLLLPMRGHP